MNPEIRRLTSVALSEAAYTSRFNERAFCQLNMSSNRSILAIVFVVFWVEDLGL
jgi:hypothetical protein